MASQFLTLAAKIAIFWEEQQNKRLKIQLLLIK
jgi:hypothetical protein